MKKDSILSVLLSFKPPDEEGGRDSFTTEGFRNWKRSDKFGISVGGPNSACNKARGKAENLLKRKQSIETSLLRQSDHNRREYRTQLDASLQAIRYLLKQDLAFRGHDESCEARNRGNFLQLLRLLSHNSDEIRSVVLTNAPENHKLTSPDI